MTKPNFFIIGAPKCGTTSLAAWLSDNERIFMSHPKEPHFFNTDHSNRTIENKNEYYHLFPRETGAYIAIGEASVHYLSSAVAVPNILESIENPKFIVCLRDPADMVVSYHNQLLNALAEDIPDLADAWEAQRDRLAGRRIPETCPEPSRLQYSQSGRLAQQLERLFTHITPDQVRIVFLDQIQRNPLGVYRHLLEFLDVPYDGKQDFPKLNSAARLRSRNARKVLTAIGRLRRRLGLPRFNSRILQTLVRLNMATGSRNAPLDKAFVDTVLRPFFAEEAQKLQVYRNPALDIDQ